MNVILKLLPRVLCWQSFWFRSPGPKAAQCEIWPTWPNPAVHFVGQRASTTVLHLDRFMAALFASALVRLHIFSSAFMVRLQVVVGLPFLILSWGFCPELVLWCCFWVASECVLSSHSFVHWWCLWWMTGLFLSIILSCWSSLAIWFVEFVGGIKLFTNTCRSLYFFLVCFQVSDPFDARHTRLKIRQRVQLFKILLIYLTTAISCKYLLLEPL